MVKISKEELFAKGKEQNIPPEKLQTLWDAFEGGKESSAPYLKWLYFLGALLAIFSMTWFLNLSWEWLGSGAAFLIGAVYAILFTLLGNHFWKKGETLPGGLLITMAVSMVPVMVYSLQAYFWSQAHPMEPYGDFYATISGQWVYIEIATLIAGILAYYFYPFPFLMAPISIAAWFLTMDIIPYLFGKELDFDQKAWLTLFFGAILIAISYLIREGFWLSLGGAFAFFGAVGCLLWDRGEIKMGLFLLVSILMMLLSIPLKRAIFMILGAIGTFAYLGHLSYKYFQDSIWFPIILTLIGLALIYLAILFQRNKDKIIK